MISFFPDFTLCFVRLETQSVKKIAQYYTYTVFTMRSPSIRQIKKHTTKHFDFCNGVSIYGLFSLLFYRLTRVSQKNEVNLWWVAWTDNDIKFIVFVLTTFRVECHCWKTNPVIVIFMSRVLTYVVCCKLFWNWIWVLRFVVHKVLFDKGFVVSDFLIAVLYKLRRGDHCVFEVELFSLPMNW